MLPNQTLYAYSYSYPYSLYKNCIFFHSFSAILLNSPFCIIFVYFVSFALDLTKITAGDKHLKIIVKHNRLTTNTSQQKKKKKEKEEKEGEEENKNSKINNQSLFKLHTSETVQHSELVRRIAVTKPIFVRCFVHHHHYLDQVNAIFMNFAYVMTDVSCDIFLII